MKTFLKHFVGSDRGASMVEYGLMVALIALITIPGVAIAENQIQVVFDDLVGSLAAEDEDGAGDESPAPGDDDDTPAPGDDDDDTPAPGDDDDDTPAPGDDDDTPAPGDDDDDTPAPGDDDDTPAPGGDDDDTPAPGDDDDTPAPGDDDDDTPAPGGDDDPAPGGDDDDDPAPGDPGSEAVVASTDSSFFWWNSTKNGGEGAWKATVNYTNDHNRHQFLILEITRTDDRGNTTTTRVNEFYVPANGNANFEVWDNNLKVNKAKTTGIVSVQVQVVSVTTADENSNPVTYPQYGNSTTVNAPTP